MKRNGEGKKTIEGQDKAPLVCQSLSGGGIKAPSLLYNRLSSMDSQDLESILLDLTRQKAIDSLEYFCKDLLGYKEMSTLHTRLCASLQKGIVNQDPTEKSIEEAHQNRPKGQGIRECLESPAPTTLTPSQTTPSFPTAIHIRKPVQKKSLYLLPRGTFKSTVITIGYSLWRLARDPDLRILIDSETQSNSKNFLSEIKEQMVRNEVLRGAFPPMDSKDEALWTKTEITVKTRKRARKEPSIQATGVDITKTGMHYDLIIADDLVSNMNIGTIEMRDKVIAHYKLLLALLEPDGELIVVGTRWHDDDVYGWILEHDLEGWEVMIEKAIRDDGSLLFPERLTKEFLDNQKKAMGTYLWSCQYQNSPIDEDSQVFRKAWIQYYLPGDVDYTKLNRYMAIDPAISDSKDSDYSAIVVVGVDKNNNLYVLDYLRERLTPNDLIEAIFRMRKHWTPIKTGIEVFAFQKALQYEIRDRMRKKGEFFVLEAFTTDTRTGKTTRIKGLQPRFENKTVYLKRDMDEMEDELLRFPLSNRDDLIDALSYTLQLFDCPYDLEAERMEQEQRERDLAPVGSCGY